MSCFKNGVVLRLTTRRLQGCFQLEVEEPEEDQLQDSRAVAQADCGQLNDAGKDTAPLGLAYRSFVLRRARHSSCLSR